MEYNDDELVDHHFEAMVMAHKLHEYQAAFVAAGFTDDQAFRLVYTMHRVLAEGVMGDR